MCDIEGAEAELFSKDKIHLLKGTSFCIELHYWNSVHNKILCLNYLITLIILKLSIKKASKVLRLLM